MLAQFSLNSVKFRKALWMSSWLDLAEDQCLRANIPPSPVLKPKEIHSLHFTSFVFTLLQFTCSSSCSGKTEAACLSSVALVEQSLLLTLWMVEMTSVSSASSLVRLLDGDIWDWADLAPENMDLRENRGDIRS